MTEEYREGCRAFELGAAITDNPYDWCSHRYHFWAAGWQDASDGCWEFYND